MSDRERIFQLFAEANPAPTDAPPTIERPPADAILRDRREPTMLTQEPKLTKPRRPSPTRRTWRGPAVALASFVAIALLGGVTWLLGSADDEGDVGGTSIPPTTTLAPQVTTVPPTSIAPIIVDVPDLVGLTLAEARGLVEEFGLEVRAVAGDIESAIVVAQEPASGAEVDEGTVVSVDLQIVATCNPPDPVAPGVGEVIITVLFECGNDDVIPTPGVGVARIVPEQGGEPIDRIEWTLRSLLAGLTPDEEAVGFVSGFDAATAAAMDGATLTGGRLVVDFNDAIIVNNMGTATGMVQFNAELYRNVFLHPEVEAVEFHLNGDCEAWSALFESDGCRETTRADWDQSLAEWDALRNQ